MAIIAGTMDEAHYMCSRPDYYPITTEREFIHFLTTTTTKRQDGSEYTLFTLYNNNMHAGQRRGQAFMNALPEEDYTRLTGSLIDPFHKDDMRSIFIALDYLLFSKES